MKANEMQRYRYQNDFPNDYDGIVDDKDGELVFYEDAMQIITALQEKIDGMIKRPKVEVVGDEEDCWYCILDSWQLDTGQRVREFWAPDEGERWLPLSALPKGDV